MIRRYVEKHFGGSGTPLPPADPIDLSNRRIVGVAVVVVAGIPSGNSPELSFGPLVDLAGAPVQLNPVQVGVTYPVVIESVPEVTLSVGAVSPIPGNPTVLGVVDVTFEQED